MSAVPSRPQTPTHMPVMLEEVVELLQPRNGGRYLDATVGLGGHAAAVLESSSSNGQLIGADADDTALAIANDRLAPYGDRVQLHRSWLDEAPDLVRELGRAPLDGALCDLGVSSLQLESAARGFSLQADGPLDMRMNVNADHTDGPSVDEMVNHWPASQLADLIYEFGEERRSRRIARIIVERRPIAGTADLAAAVVAAVGRRPGSRIHPATRVFQALRIATNRELDRLSDFLMQVRAILRVGGRLVVIAFHSLEDRIVKRFLRDQARADEPPFRLLTRRVLRPSERECAENPRARSARLRAAEAI